jgi:hypothetical protein
MIRLLQGKRKMQSVALFKCSAHVKSRLRPKLSRVNYYRHGQWVTKVMKGINARRPLNVLCCAALRFRDTVSISPVDGFRHSLEFSQSWMALESPGRASVIRTAEIALVNSK